MIKSILIVLFLYFNCFSFVNANSLPVDSIYNLNSEMIDKNGNKFNISELRGHVQILSMIYTNCKTICPIIVSNMKAIEKKLPNEILQHVKFTLISLDSDRDTPNSLSVFFKEKKLNNDRWILLKTSKRETLEIALSLGIKYKKIDNEEFVHSNLIIVLNKDGIIKLHHQGLDKNYNNFIILLKNLSK